MKKNKILKIRIVAAAVLALMCGATASGETVPSLVFTGLGEETAVHPQETYGRIYLGEESFKLHSLTDETAEDIELPYNLFNHLEFKEMEASSGVESVAESDSARIRYIAETQTIRLDAPADADYALGIYNVDGVLVAASHLGTQREVSLAGLPKGTYVALATDGSDKLTLKFIVK